MKATVNVTTAADGNRLEETRDCTRRCNRLGEARIWRAGIAKDDSFPGRIVGGHDPAARMGGPPMRHGLPDRSHYGVGGNAPGGRYPAQCLQHRPRARRLEYSGKRQAP